MYNKNMLVSKIFEQTLIPTHVLNADVYQKAINVQAYLMVNADSEKVRTDAANSLLNHLKKPETSKVQLDISYKEDKTLEDLRATTQALVEQQRRLLEEKVINAKDVAEAVIISSEVEDA
jgi:glutamine synthetase type III